MTLFTKLHITRQQISGFGFNVSHTSRRINAIRFISSAVYTTLPHHTGVDSSVSLTLSVSTFGHIQLPVLMMRRDNNFTSK